MKIGTKLIIGFMTIASLVGFVGIFSAISHKNIQINSKIITKVLELDILLDKSLVKLLALVQTENAKDYLREKTDYEKTRAEFDALFNSLNNEYAQKLPDLGFDVKLFRKDAGELAKISNRLIALQKQCLAKDKASKEKKSRETELRDKTLTALFALQDNALIKDAELMQYKSKEALYQYKDQEHGIEWLETISKVKDNPLIIPLEDVSKDLNTYGHVAQDIFKIIVEQKIIETQKHLAFIELKELIHRLEENQARIVNKIKTESQILARNTHLIIFAVITGAFLVSIILGLTIARSISKPVANLARTTQAIAQGDFSVRVDVAKADEIGQLAASFNKMTEDLQETTTSIDNLNQEIAERKRVEADLKAAQETLIETAHRAGMAEVAADVLHNVGNVLNSINVSTTLVVEKLTNSELANLEKLASLINDHTEDIGTFLTEHPQGKHIPVYLTEVSKCLTDEQAEVVSRLRVLTDNVEHIKEIISMQQSYAKVSGVEAQTSLAKLVEDAIQINSAGLERHGTRLVREFEEFPDVEIDKQKVLQILVNLISNAKYALSGSDKEEKLLTVRLYKHSEDRFRIEVADNGVGISEDNLTKIFGHGFTTKEHGHGFGLHSSALACDEIGGSLTVHSEGVGQGATFTLELPFKSVGVMQ